MKKSVLVFDQWETEQGSQVLFLNIPDIPMVDIRLIFAAGSAYDNSKYGLAHLTNLLLNYGTNTLSAEEIATGLESAGARINFDTDRDMAYIHLRSLAAEKYLTKALTLLNEIVTQSSFPEDKFLHNQNLVLNALKRQLQMPEIIARNTLFATIFSQHPYSSSVLGSDSSIQQLTIEDIKQFYHNYYQAKNATLVIVGDLSRKKAEKISGQLLKGLAVGSKAPAIPIAATNQKMVQTVAFNSNQTHVILGQVGTIYQDPLYFPLLLGNTIFDGGAITSRLFHTIRSKHGLAYHISSLVKVLKGRGLNIIVLQTKNESVAKAIDLTTALLSNYIEQGPGAKELSTGKSTLIRRFPLQFSTNEDLVNLLTVMSYYDLSADFFDNYCSNIKKISAQEIKEAFAQYFSVERMAIVKVGAD
jgi:zinc protease